MSQVDKILKGIAAGEEYRSLADAIDKNDYDAIGKAYEHVGALLAGGKKQVLEKLQALPRQNKDQERANFEAAYARRLSSDVPAWHRISSLLKEKGVAQGEVYVLGKKGDPLVRSPEGRLVVVAGSKAQPGEKVLYRVEAKGEKLDFGREAKLDADFFYVLLNGDMLDAFRKSLDETEAHIKAVFTQPGKLNVQELSQLLTELEGVRSSIERLRESERGKYVARVRALRRRLLDDWVARSIFDFVASEEENDISLLCAADEGAKQRAMSAPGLFRRQSHEALKSELISGGEVRGYSDALAAMEKDLDSMDAALKLMEFKSGVDEMVPLAKTYIERMDHLFDNIGRRSRRVSATIAENGIHSADEIDAAIREEFSGPALCYELRAAFRNAREFQETREALVKLRTMLGLKESNALELAIKPYLAKKTSIAFRGRGKDEDE